MGGSYSAPSSPDQMKGLNFFGDTSGEAKELALRYLVGCEERKGRRRSAARQGNPKELVTVRNSQWRMVTKRGHRSNAGADRHPHSVGAIIPAAWGIV